MSENNLQLDFTLPGAIPPDPLEEVWQIVAETQTKMQILEALLEKEQVKDITGWKLLAMFYLATQRINNLTKIEKLYQKITGTSLSASLKQEYTSWFSGKTTSELIIFEIPKKITAEALPDSMVIRHRCNTFGQVLLNFSKVQEIDNDGLKKLAKFFSTITQGCSNLKLKQIDHFIICLQNKAEASTGTHLIWEVLFAYERLRNNKEAFEEKAIKFAILFGVSPPSWE